MELGSYVILLLGKLIKIQYNQIIAKQIVPRLKTGYTASGFNHVFLQMYDLN